MSGKKTLNVGEGGKVKKKKKFRNIVKSILGLKSGAKRNNQTLEFEDRNRKVDSSVNGWISSEYATDLQEREVLERSLVPEANCQEEEGETTEPSSDTVDDTDTERPSKGNVENAVLSVEELSRNDDLKKKKMNKNLTFSHQLTSIRVFERENSNSTTSDCDQTAAQTKQKDSQESKSTDVKSSVSHSSITVALDENDDNDEDDNADEGDRYDDFTYRELQARAKEFNIPANIKKTKMIAAIREKEETLLLENTLANTVTAEPNIFAPTVQNSDNNGAIEEDHCQMEIEDDEDEEDDEDISCTWHISGGIGHDDDSRASSAVSSAVSSGIKDLNVEIKLGKIDIEKDENVVGALQHDESGDEECDTWHTRDDSGHNSNSNDPHGGGELNGLLGIDDDEEEVDNFDDDVDLTDAIQGFFVQHHCNETKSDMNVEESNMNDVVESKSHGGDDIDSDEELDQFNELHLDNSSLQGSSVGLSHVLVRGESKDMDDTDDDSRPKIMPADRSSKFSVDSVMGDIVLEENILEDDSDIISRTRRQHMLMRAEEESTVVPPEEDFSLKIFPSNETPALNEDRLRDMHWNGANECKFAEHARVNPDPKLPSLALSDALPPAVPKTKKTSFFEFVELTAPAPIEEMRSSLQDLESRLVKISPAGLHPVLAKKTNNCQQIYVPRERTDSLPDSYKSEMETDQFNDSQPLPKRFSMSRSNSNKTFDTVSSLGSSDVVDLKHKKLLKKHADEKRRQKKQQDEFLLKQRQERQAQRALLKESSTAAIDQALASQRSYPSTSQEGQSRMPGGSDHLADHFAQTTSNTPVLKSQSCGGGVTRSYFHRAGSYGQSQQPSREQSFPHSNKVVRNPPRHLSYHASSDISLSDSSAMRNATSDVLIDTFKSRSQRSNSARGLYPRVSSSANSKQLSHSHSGGSNDESNGHSRKPVVDIYKPLPPEYVVDNKSVQKPRGSSRLRGTSSNSSNVSDGDTTYQPSVQSGNSGDEESTSRSSSSVISTPRLNSRSTAASRMRAAAIKDRSFMSPYSSPSTSTFDQSSRRQLASSNSVSHFGSTVSPSTRGASASHMRSQSTRNFSNISNSEVSSATKPHVPSLVSTDTTNIKMTPTVASDVPQQQDSEAVLSPKNNAVLVTSVPNSSTEKSLSSTKSPSTSLIRRARAITSSRSDKPQHEGGNASGSNDRVHSLSPVRPALNPFQAII